jgi:Cu-Zn family superoxide dismutase
MIHNCYFKIKIMIQQRINLALIALASGFALNSCKKDVAPPVIREAYVSLESTSANKSEIGKASFKQTDSGPVIMTLQITIPERANQNVAIHFHEHGMCGDAGNHAGGHWNPTNKKHGSRLNGEHHAGDVGNLMLDGQGKGQISIESTEWSIENTVNKSIIGKGVIIHGGTDDFTTQTTGNSGPRIGCGVIMPK